MNKTDQIKKAKFAMAFHCHQPVFNFEREIERAYRDAYLPLINVIEMFPEVKVTFHYSGNVLEWLEKKHSEYLKRLKRLIERQQVEILGGGYFEPIMALIPEHDRKSQLEMNDKIISRTLGVNPKGAWLAERVWEQELTDTLINAGVEYTILDDNHFFMNKFTDKEVFRPYKMEGKNGSLTLLPASTKLRYLMPFKIPENTFDYMRTKLREKITDEVCFFFADDGEKFGMWPFTNNLVYRRGWLKQFFTLLEKNSDWIQSLTFSEVVDTVEPFKVNKIKNSSYVEMMEWADGDFKNFLEKYPELNRMHKRMIGLSNSIKTLRKGKTSDTKDRDVFRAEKELYKAQSSCAYWHGTFGGFYLPHLRSGIYKHLIKGQNIVDKCKQKKDITLRVLETDLDNGQKETVIDNKFLRVYIDSKFGASISELDSKISDFNLSNTVSRGEEKYHNKLDKEYVRKIREARRAALMGKRANVHDVLGVGEKGLKKFLIYDDYKRNSFLTHIFKGSSNLGALGKNRSSSDSFLKGEYSSEIEISKELITYTSSKRDKIFKKDSKEKYLEVEKQIIIGHGPSVMFSHSIENLKNEEVSFKYGVEFNFLIWDSKAIQGKRNSFKTNRFSLKDMYSSSCLDFFMDKEIDVSMYPIYTVNETEAGLKKTFQGISVLLERDCSLSGNSTEEIKVSLAVR